MTKYKSVKKGDDTNLNQNKKKRIKEPKIRSESEEEIRRFIIILVVIVLIVLGIYFLSKVIVDKRENTLNKTVTEGTIDYNLVSVGTILNRPYTEYYVIVYDADDTNAMYYASLVAKHQTNEDAEKIYFCNLGNALNSAYVSKEETGNSNAKATEDFSFGRITLLKIKNGKVISYLENLDDIKKELI